MQSSFNFAGQSGGDHGAVAQNGNPIGQGLRACAARACGNDQILGKIHLTAGMDHPLSNGLIGPGKFRQVCLPPDQLKGLAIDFSRVGFVFEHDVPSDSEQYRPQGQLQPL